MALPKRITTAGCMGGTNTCDVLQSGCAWQAACSTGTSSFTYRGTAVPNGIKFEGQNAFKCWAYKQEGDERLVGGCSRTGVEVSECSPRVSEGKLFVTLP